MKKTAAHVLVEIIQNSEWMTIIHINDPFQLITEVEEETGVKLKYKNLQDDFETSRGYIWSRQNKRKFQLTIA